jgi:hypothetical protein
MFSDKHTRYHKNVNFPYMDLYLMESPHTNSLFLSIQADSDAHMKTWAFKERSKRVPYITKLYWHISGQVILIELKAQNWTEI